MPTLLKSLQAELRAPADPDRAQVMKRFFRTGPGEYGEVARRKAWLKGKS